MQGSASSDTHSPADMLDTLPTNEGDGDKPASQASSAPEVAKTVNIGSGDQAPASDVIAVPSQIDSVEPAAQRAGDPCSGGGAEATMDNVDITLDQPSRNGQLYCDLSNYGCLYITSVIFFVSSDLSTNHQCELSSATSATK